jgi:hypothetical protein
MNNTPRPFLARPQPASDYSAITDVEVQHPSLWPLIGLIAGSFIFVLGLLKAGELLLAVLRWGLA